MPSGKSSKSGTKANTTKKSVSTKEGVAKKTTATKTKIVSVADKDKTVRESNSTNFPAIILAEIVGTFTLTMVALASMQQTDSLYIGLTMAVMVLVIGAISGSHINPAVTFGLWAARKVKTAVVPVYWLAQFVGSIIAILVLGLFTGDGYPLSFGNFADIHWGVLGAEGIGALIFLFGFTALYSNDKLAQTTKAFGIGLSLTLGLVVSMTALTTVQTAKINEFQNTQASEEANDVVKGDRTYPAEVYIKGTTVNPAVALASTDYTESQLSGMSANPDETMYTRFDLDTIIGTLVGAALGANLYLLVEYATRVNRK